MECQEEASSNRVDFTALKIRKVSLHFGRKACCVDACIPKSLRMPATLGVYNEDGCNIDSSLTNDGEPESVSQVFFSVVAGKYT